MPYYAYVELYTKFCSGEMTEKCTRTSESDLYFEDVGPYQGAAYIGSHMREGSYAAFRVTTVTGYEPFHRRSRR